MGPFWVLWADCSAIDSMMLRPSDEYVWLLLIKTPAPGVVFCANGCYRGFTLPIKSPQSPKFPATCHFSYFRVHLLSGWHLLFHVTHSWLPFPQKISLWQVFVAGFFVCSWKKHKKLELKFSCLERGCGKSGKTFSISLQTFRVAVIGFWSAFPSDLSCVSSVFGDLFVLISLRIISGSSAMSLGCSITANCSRHTYIVVFI